MSSANANLASIASVTPASATPWTPASWRGKPGLQKFAPIDIQICSVRVRPRSYDIRNALFDTVPFPDKLFGDIVAGAELYIFFRNQVSCRRLVTFGELNVI